MDEPSAPSISRLLTLMAVRTVINTMHRMVYPFLTVFGRGLGVDLAQISLALTARSALGVTSPLVSSAADRYGRRVGILLGVLVFTLGAGLVVLFPTFNSFLGALMLTSFGKFLVDASVHAHLGDKVPYKNRGFAVAVVEMGWSISFIVGVPLMGLVIARYGWLSPFRLLVLLGVVSIGVVVFFLPSDRHSQQDSSTLWENIRKVLGSPQARAGLMVGLMLSAGNEMINLVFGAWLEEVFNLQVVALGGASLVIGLSEFVGESLVGGLTDRLGKKRAVAGGVFLNSLAAIFLFFAGKSLAGALAGLFLFYITFEFSLVSSISIMTEIAPEARATMLSLNIAALSSGRALAALIAAPVFFVGLLASVSFALFFNLWGFLALRKIKK